MTVAIGAATLVGGGGSGTFSLSATAAYSCYGANDPAAGEANSSTEARVQTTQRLGASALSNMVVNYNANALTATLTYTSRLNGAAGNLSVVVTASTAGLFSDTTHSDSIAIGNTVDYHYLAGTGSGSSTVGGTTAVQAWSSGQARAQLSTSIADSQANALAAGATNFLSFCGYGLLSGNHSNTTEALLQMQALESATIQNMQLYLSANTVTGASTGHSRIGAANGNQSLAITGSTTGFFEDTTHSDALTTGKLFNGSIVAGSGGTSLTLFTASIMYTSGSANKAPAYAGQFVSLGSSGTAYTPLWGSGAAQSSETCQQPIATPVIASNLSISCSVNTDASAQTLKWRDNGATKNQVATITGNTTGVFTDTTHTDACAVNDLVDTLASGNTGTSTVFDTGAVLLTGGINNSQTESISQASSAKALWAVNKLTSVVRASVASVVWAVSKLLNQAQASAVNIVWIVSKLIAVTRATAISILFAAAHQRIIAVAQSNLVSTLFVAAHQRVLTAVQSTSSAIIWNIGQLFTMVQAGVSSFTWAVTRLIGFAQANSAAQVWTINRTLGYQQANFVATLFSTPHRVALSVAQASAASVQWAIGKIIVATQVTTSALQRAADRLISVVQSSAVATALVKAHNVAVNTVQGLAVLTDWYVSKLVRAIQAETASTLWTISRSLGAPVISVASTVTKEFSLVVLSAAESASVSARWLVAKIIGATQTTASFVAQTYYRILSATQATIVSVSKLMPKLLSVVQQLVASVSVRTIIIIRRRLGGFLQAIRPRGINNGSQD